MLYRKNNKQRKLKTQTWVLRLPKDSTLKIKYKESFYKKDIIDFINKNLWNCVGGYVELCFNTKQIYATNRRWFIWYKKTNKGYVCDLKQETFRGRKYICKISKLEKESKTWFSFSEKVSNLMLNISDDDVLKQKQIKNLLTLFEKRGYNSSKITQEYKDCYVYESYVNGTENIPWSYWSDRCNFLRCWVIEQYYIRNYEH